jgi:transcription-repair coupling factor (superfamily II helicase)
VREDPVRAVGEFSIRGGILDVWPPGTDTPARIEFFGDTVDSIRSFDQETQLSTAQLAELEIAPMREFTVTARDFRDWAAIARERWRDERFARALHDRTVYADEGEDFPGWEWLLPLVRENNASALDYFKDAVLVIDEPATIESYLASAFQTLEERHAETDAADDLGLAPHELYLTPEELRAGIDALPRIELRALGRTAAKIDEEIALEAEEPKVSVGKQRAKRKPLFLFPHETSASSQLAPQEVEWKSHSALRYHGRLPDLSREVIERRANHNATTLFVMPG